MIKWPCVIPNAGFFMPVQKIFFYFKIMFVLLCILFFNLKFKQMEKPENEMYAKYLKALKELYRQSQSEKPIPLSGFFKHHQITHATKVLLEEIGAAEIVAAGSVRDGQYITFVREPDVAMVTKFIEAYRKYNQELHKKHYKKGGTVTSAVRRTTTKKQTLDNLDFLIDYMREKLNKEANAPGYLRPDEVIQFPKVVAAMVRINTLKDVLPKVTEAISLFQNTLQ